MAVKSPIESLPNELFDCILDLTVDDHVLTTRRDYRPLSRLSQCSRFLRCHLEPWLYSTPNARSAALNHGCKTGNLGSIRKAVSYGANPGTIEISKSHNNTDATLREILSLQVALRTMQLGAFRLLLELGAGIGPRDCADDNLRRSQLQQLGQALSRSRHVEFLTAFIEARAQTPDSPDRSDSPSQAQMLVRQLILPEVVRWATPGLLETLINEGAALNDACTDGNKEFLTPLSAACLRGDSDLFNFLVSKGADVNIESSTGKYHSWQHTATPQMLQTCVDAGADINRMCHVDPDPFPDNSTQTHVCTTPLLTYLSSIETWKSTPLPAESDGKLRPTEGVVYFIEKLGADTSSPVVRPVKRPYLNPDRDLHDRTFGGIPSPVEVLLTKWGVESIAEPEFFSVVKLLVEHGGTGPDLGRILVRFEGRNKASSNVDLKGLWQKFMALLVPQLTSLDQKAKNALLRRVIVDKAGMRDRVAQPSRWIAVGAIGQASIDALINAGADINDVSPPGAPWPEMNTPLHQIISSFVHTDRLTEDYLHDHDKSYDCPRTGMNARAFGDFLAFLVSRGADPLIEDMREHRKYERTAIDTLESPMKEGRIEYDGGTTERGLMHLVAKLRGTSEELEFTGARMSYRKSTWRFMASYKGNSGWCKAVDKAEDR